MTAFEFVTVALSLILGLGITQLLTALVRLFEDRDHVGWDWITLTWTGSIFFAHLHFWWAVFRLSGTPEWSFPAFLLLVGEGLCLFLAASLILPRRRESSRTDLRDHLAKTGRWAVMAVIAYALLGVVFDLVLFEIPVVSGWNALRLGMVVVLLGVFASPSRRVQGTGTLLWVGVQLYWALPTVSVSF